MTSWLPTLKTDTPQDGFELAVKLARMAVKMTQPDEEARNAMRPGYANDAGDLIAASHVVAVHFPTIATANNHWSKNG